MVIHYQYFLFSGGKSKIFMYSDDIDPDDYLDSISEEDMPLDDQLGDFDQDLLDDPELLDSILEEIEDEDLEELLDQSFEDIDIDDLEELEDFEDIDEFSEEEIQELLEAFDQELDIDADINDISLDDLENLEDFDYNAES